MKIEPFDSYEIHHWGADGTYKPWAIYGILNEKRTQISSLQTKREATKLLSQIMGRDIQLAEGNTFGIYPCYAREYPLCSICRQSHSKGLVHASE